MPVNNINMTGTTLQNLPKAGEQLDQNRKDLDKANSKAGESEAAPSDVQPEEVLDKIKALTDNGQFSVRFENHSEFEELIVKVVDSKTDEVIRQVPAEEVLGVKMSLAELRGNLVNTSS